MSVPATPENVAAAIADPTAPLPVGARRMTEPERQMHVSNVLNALFKQSKVRSCTCSSSKFIYDVVCMVHI